MAAVELINSTLYSDANLKAYWQFESNSNATVGSQNGTDSNMSYVAGKFGNAASFNNTSGKITIADNATMSITTNGTWLFWFKAGNITTNGNDVIFAQWVASNYAFNIVHMTSSGDLQANFSPTSSGSGGTDLNGTTAITTDWTMIALVKSGATITWYVNGSAAGTSSTQANPLYASVADFIWGNNGNNDGYLDGLIDDFAIFDRALTSTEIADHYSGADSLATPSGKNFLAFM